MQYTYFYQKSPYFIFIFFTFSSNFLFTYLYKKPMCLKHIGLIRKYSKTKRPGKFQVFLIFFLLLCCSNIAHAINKRTVTAMIHNALTAFTMAGAFLFRTGAVRLIAMFFFHKLLRLLWIIYNFAVLPEVRHKYLYG